MSKVRIYELAKELGLENKAVLTLCNDLGIEGKKSHSNSLSEGEADKIRRYVIRSAVSEKKGDSVREVRRSGEVMTERRVGGRVIRRRKKVEEEGAEEEGAEDGESTESVPFGSDVPQTELPSLVPNLQAEHETRQANLRAADALFGKEEQPEQVEAPAVEAESQESAAEQAVEATAEVEVEAEDKVGY